MFLSRLKIHQRANYLLFSLCLTCFGLPQSALAETVHTTINGKVLFDKLCVSCHGSLGTPPETMQELLEPYPADLRSGTYRYGNSYKEIYHSISKGRGTNMLPFNNRLSARQIEAVTKYVMSLREDVHKTAKELSLKPEPQEADEPNQEAAQGQNQ